MKRTKITEEEGIHKIWYVKAEAEEMTLETLPAFLKELSEAYDHDYGTIVHAIGAAAIAAATAMNHTEQGGITGFQASAVMWQFIMYYGFDKQDKPLRLMDYSNLLYPQYDEKFSTISKDTWEWLQKEAKKNLQENKDAHPDVIHRWEMVAGGFIPCGLKVEN